MNKKEKMGSLAGSGTSSSCCKVESLISVDERGQMVLPKDLREKANIKPGDKLAVISWEKDGATCCFTLIKVFQEAFRVLKPGGRLMVSDIVLKKELPEEIRTSVAAYTACVAGAETRENYLGAVRGAGFQEMRILDETIFPTKIFATDPMAQEIVKNLNLSPQKARELAQSVVSIKVSAVKPGG